MKGWVRRRGQDPRALEGPPAVDPAHGDLTGRQQRPEQHGGGLGAGQQGRSTPSSGNMAPTSGTRARHRKGRPPDRAPMMLTSSMDATPVAVLSTPHLGTFDAVGGRPPHRLRLIRRSSRSSASQGCPGDQQRTSRRAADRGSSSDRDRASRRHPHLQIPRGAAPRTGALRRPPRERAADAGRFRAEERATLAGAAAVRLRMITAPLRGRDGAYSVVVDNLEALAGLEWSVVLGGTRRRPYACRSIWVSGRSTRVCLHSMILEAPPGLRVCFRNGDSLDCRRENLAIMTKKPRWSGTPSAPCRSSAPTRTTPAGVLVSVSTAGGSLSGASPVRPRRGRPARACSFLFLILS